MEEVGPGNGCCPANRCRRCKPPNHITSSGGNCLRRPATGSLHRWNAPAVSQTVVDLYAEAIDPFEVLRFDPGAMPPLVGLAIQVLSQVIQDPASVSLVLCDDLATSVRHRLPAERAARFTTERGGGHVGAKTMLVGDRIEVLVPSGLFLGEHGDHQDFADQLAVRTVAHEGYHVLLKQRREELGNWTGDPVDHTQLLLSCADQVIEEYRVEAAIHPLPFPLVVGHKPKDVVRPWTQRVATVALVEYQEHLDVGRLIEDTMNACRIAWIGLGYIAARIAVTDDEPSAARPHRKKSRQRWEQVVEPHWEQFCDVLATVPSAMERKTLPELEPARAALAALFGDWLQTVGFRLELIDDGVNFTIENFDALEAWLA